MINKWTVWLLAGGIALQANAQTAPKPPNELFGQLFTDVQLSKIFPDNKTFVDCVPKKNPAEILADYLKIINNPSIRFSLPLFIQQNFEIPPTPPAFTNIPSQKTATDHIQYLWEILKRDGLKKTENKSAWVNGSLLPLPNQYIVPGGRFREIYYWDSYFTMLGLQISGQQQMIENMVDNFSFLINTYGHIPNGNRSYYLSRSQPPFFSLMVQLLAGIKGNDMYKTYLPSLIKEYNYWTDKTAPTRHTVTLPDGSTLSRYYDRDDIPRQESYLQDYALSKDLPAEKAATLNRNLRSGAESGWDFSSRWFADGKYIATIETTNILPIDLNCLLYQLETTIAKGYKLLNKEGEVKLFIQKANSRIKAIEKYCWNKNKGFYFDYNASTKKQSELITPAAMFALCLLNHEQEVLNEKGKMAAKIIKEYLLKDGGIITTNNNTGQQWDAPNGWAPLQWMTVWGLQKSNQKPLALEIAKRWTALNEKVYKSTGKMMEKYNVLNTQLEAGGGEYPSQDGFGWTNGVYLALKKLLANN